MMKIMVTGSSGMLGRALCQELSERYEITGMDIVQLKAHSSKLKGYIECDITDREKTIAGIVSVRPDTVIHAAAYTDVDGCELNKEKAKRINAFGTETIALACQKCGAFLFYISTDFVFDGKKTQAYLETDEPHPLNVYGRSKLAAEHYVQSMLKRAVIVRSSWLFGKGGRNFVDIILAKAKEQKSIRVVNDEYGSPTYAEDLAQALARLLTLIERLSGIYHITNSGSASRYEFALAIKKIANLDADIIPISSREYSSPTTRPKMSILENRRYNELLGEKLRHWNEALKAYLLK